jgi:hypothetical protein
MQRQFLLRRWRVEKGFSFQHWAAPDLLSACAELNCSAFFVPAVACALEPYHVLLCWDIPQHDGLGEA